MTHLWSSEATCRVPSFGRSFNSIIDPPLNGPIPQSQGVADNRADSFPCAKTAKLRFQLSALLGQPDSLMTAGRVCYNMRYDIEASSIKQGSILLWAEATVVQRVTFQLAYCSPLFIAAREHQRGAWRGMGLEPGEHRALITRREVEEAVPSEQP